MFLAVGNRDKTAPPRVPHLRLVRDDAPAVLLPALYDEVRSARRDMARLLRALQATGRSVTSWPYELVTRLAHVDTVTARYLIDRRGGDDSVGIATHGMRAIERWVVDGLTAAVRSEVRAFELLIRIEDHELDQPLLQPDGSPEEHTPALGLGHTMPPRSLRAGLRALDDESLRDLGRRLGVRPLQLETGEQPEERMLLVATIVSTLRDDHLLSILVATIGAESQGLLGDLVRGHVNLAELRALARPAHVVAVVGSDVVSTAAPIDALRECGLVFSTGSGSERAVWVPVELQPRIDGVLRAFGL